MCKSSCYYSTTCIWRILLILLTKYFIGAITLECCKGMGAQSICYGCFVSFYTLTVFMLYVVLSFNYTKKEEKNYFSLIPISLINGIMSAFIIFIIGKIILITNEMIN